ncbi:MAG: paraquat-inducible protein A [Planctomycetes bacterium]|nr:paraquat-inducible protein A [Planctomycetota bacterium]
MLHACPCCGLTQAIPELARGTRACCRRCDSTLRSASRRRRGNSRTAAVACAALIMYPLAVSLPIVQVAKLGQHSEASILEGTARLLADGHLGVGLIVFACSVVLPLFKLVCLLVLSAGAGLLGSRRSALTFRLIEWTGRWGMLDVLCVAILVAAVKLGDFVTVSAGPGALAFAVCVLLSLAATACFDHRALWEAGA